MRRAVIGLSSRICSWPDLIVSEIDGEAVVMDVEGQRYFILDVIGARIWKSSAEPPLLEALCSTLLEEYDAPREVVEHDMLKLVATLASTT